MCSILRKWISCSRVRSSFNLGSRFPITHSFFVLPSSSLLLPSSFHSPFAICHSVGLHSSFFVLYFSSCPLGGGSEWEGVLPLSVLHSSFSPRALPSAAAVAAVDVKMHTRALSRTPHVDSLNPGILIDKGTTGDSDKCQSGGGGRRTKSPVFNTTQRRWGNWLISGGCHAPFFQFRTAWGGMGNTVLGT